MFTCDIQISRISSKLIRYRRKHTPRRRPLTTAPPMSVEFLTASKLQDSTATPTPSSTDTPYTYNFGSTQSESQSAPSGVSNPGIVLGVLAGLIVFFALLCTWCCRRRFSRRASAKTQVAAGSLPQFFTRGHTYSPPAAPPSAVVHEQGPWPGYPLHYHNPTDAWARPGVPSETLGPTQMSTIPKYEPQKSAPAPRSVTPQSFLYSAPPTRSNTSKHGHKRLSIGSRFPIAPHSG
ncbi:hypothetical protein EV426DRAFT_715699 [Tirmania nivea]|nr:hypothetical protein EV426DRAFT_715699 [Tirmania nivea]